MEYVPDYNLDPPDEDEYDDYEYEPEEPPDEREYSDYDYDRAAADYENGYIMINDRY